MDTTHGSSEIIITETVDGMPAELAASTRSKKKSTTPKKKKRGGKPDQYIWGIYVLLMLISCIEVFSASSTRVETTNVYAPLLDHAKFLVAGVVVALVVQRIHYKWWRSYAMALLVISIVLLIYASIWGADLNDAKRAIAIGGFTIQPPEIVKLTMVVYLAKLLAVNQEPGGVKTKACIWATILVIGVGGCLWFNGLTNALMVMVTSFAMFVIGGIEMKKLLIIIAIFIGGAGIIYVTKYSEGAKENRAETHESRIGNWRKGVSPDDKVTDDNRQVVYAHYALAHGGIKGQGPGNSRESSRLPLAYSDYIYSIIVEDTGAIGGIGLLLLYLLLLARAGRIASKCRRAFPALLIMGCAVMIVLQALVHMMIVVGIGPVSGQPLPFISKGGTSILVMSAAIGMMLSVSRYAVRTKNQGAINAELRDLPSDIQADNPALLDQ